MERQYNDNSSKANDDDDDHHKDHRFHHERKFYHTLGYVTDKVFFDVSIEDKPVGRIVFGLFGDDLPRTVDNFTTIAQGTSGVGKLGEEMTYKDTTFHRIIPGFMAQGGDFSAGDGTGGESIFGLEFEDEGFYFHHSRRYLLSMANHGPNTNGSQFFITFAPAPWLDYHHVVFGEVIEGHTVVDALEKIGTQSGKPTKRAAISLSGLVKMPPVDMAH